MLPMHSFIRIAVIFLLFLTAAGNASAQQAKIKFFEGSFEELLNKAKEDRKYMFVYLYGVPCHYCSFMDTTVFADYKVFTTYNQNFLNYKVNVSHGDFGYYDIVAAYGDNIIRAKEGYPVLLYMDTEGNILKREQGGQTISKFQNYAYDVLYRPQGSGIIASITPPKAMEWKPDDYYLPPPSETEIDRITYHQSQQDRQQPTQSAPVLKPTPQPEPKQKVTKTQTSPPVVYTPLAPKPNSGFQMPAGLESQYNRLNELSAYFRADTTQDIAIVREYAYLLLKLQLPVNAVVNYYLKLQENQLAAPHNREFIYDFSVSLENKAIDYLVQDIRYFKSVKGGDKVNEKIKNAVEHSVLTAIREKDRKLFNKAEKVIHHSFLPDRNRFLFDMQSLYYQGTQEWSTYTKIAVAYLDENQISNPKTLADIAAVFQRNVNNKKMLQKALAWVEESISIEQEYYNHFIQALLFYRLGEAEKARIAAQNAMYIAQLRNNGTDVSPCRHFLERLGNGY